jgi:transcriptional/translational regulatory protein YebC/TACO1
LTEAALVDGVVDVRFDAEEGRSEIVTEPVELAAVRDQLTTQGIKVTSMLLGFEPKQTVSPHGDEARAVLEFLDALEDHEDVQRAFSNAQLDPAELEALA